MSKIISKSDKLIKRIRREFQQKKLVGDIMITDDEFDLLINYFRKKYLSMIVSQRYTINDPVFGVALTQIGMRFYDGNFWSHVKRVLNYNKFNTNHQTWIGTSFINTMRAYGKLLLSDSERVDSILMHSFVSNHYADNFFNFLFAFYKIDLERNIDRLDSSTMNELINIMIRSDNTGRTYWLVRHTADAIRQNARGCKTRIRRCIKLIDKAFWDESIFGKSLNRLTQLFFKWKETSEDFGIERKRYNGGGVINKGKKSFSSPYIKYNNKKFSFSLILPPQIIRFNEIEDLYWIININDQISRININPYTQGVTGYITEEEVIALPNQDIFSSIGIDLMSSSRRLRQFRISSEIIRFFDNDGDFIRADSLLPGESSSFTPLDFIPVSEAVIESERVNEMIFTSYMFENGDIIRLPDGKPLSVGRKIQEGLLPRGCVSGANAILGDEIIPVYSSPPSVLAKLLPRRSSGTGIKVNNTVFRMYDEQTLVIKAATINLYDRSGESGYLFNLRDFGCTQDGMYEVYIDVPGDRTNRLWRFALITGLIFNFEDAPYIFKSRGTIYLPNHLVFTPLSADTKKEPGIENRYNFEIAAGESTLFFKYQDTEIGFDLPALSYKFDDGKWQIEPHLDIWHTEFNPKLFIKYHSDKLKIFLDNNIDDDNDEEQSEIFSKIKSRNVFECDLNRFRSWFGKNVVRRQLFLELPDIAKPLPFLGIITKSVMLSCILRGDFDNKLLIGDFDIIGNAKYYLDLFFEGKCIAQKAEIVEGKSVVSSDLRSGNYKAYIFEAEEDDSGFGDDAYFEIGRKELELLNPQDLRGKNLVITMIKPLERSTNYLELSCIYKIENLNLVNEQDKNNYKGKMLVEGSNGRILASFFVNVNFYNLEDLKFTYITFFEGNETLEFLYDEQKKIIVKYENPNLSRAQAYRRYKQSLFPEDYVFTIEFIDSI